MQGPHLHHRMIDDAQARRALDRAARFGDDGSGDEVEGLFIDQRYAGYGPDDHAAWRALFERQRAQLEHRAARSFLEGLARIGLRADAIPRLGAVSRRLHALTGWRSRAVPGYLPPRAFFACLARRCFPTTIVIRPRERLDYLPEPDIFHDVFGHVPLHADPDFSAFLELYGRTAGRTRDPRHELRLARLFWFTVEFGLIREPEGLRLYGSGLLSSPAEGVRALDDPAVLRLPFELERVCETPFEIDHFQPVLFVLDDFAQLRDAMVRYAEKLD